MVWKKPQNYEIHVQEKNFRSYLGKLIVNVKIYELCVHVLLMLRILYQ